MCGPCRGGGPAPCRYGEPLTWVRHGSSYRNPASGRCLDNPSNGSANGRRTQIWDCLDNSAQRWSVPGA